MRTTSPSSTPISSTTSTASLPGRSGTGVFSIPWNSRALWFDPLPSARRAATQCTTGTPARRAAAARRAALGIIVGRAISASWGSAARSPITPFWHSWVTSTVCEGSTRAARSMAMSGSRWSWAVVQVAVVQVAVVQVAVVQVAVVQVAVVQVAVGPVTVRTSGSTRPSGSGR